MRSGWAPPEYQLKFQSAPRRGSKRFDIVMGLGLLPKARHADARQAWSSTPLVISWSRKFVQRSNSTKGANCFMLNSIDKRDYSTPQYSTHYPISFDFGENCLDESATPMTKRNSCSDGDKTFWKHEQEYILVRLISSHVLVEHI